MNRVPRALKVTSLLLAALMAGLAGGRTTAEFSSTTANSANSFSAAASFGGNAVGDAVVVKSGVGSASYAQTVLTDAPAAYWRFGEPAGSATAVDASGNGHHGAVPTVEPKPSLGYDWSGLVGDGDTAYVWNGAEAAVTVPDAAALRLNGAFSVELWLKGRAGLVSPGEHTVLDKGGSPDVNGWQVTYDDTGVFRLRRNNVAVSSVTAILSTNSITTRHVVLTFDGTVVSWYVDGALGTSSATTFPTSSGTGVLSFAANWRTTAQTTIDEPAVYNTALGASRVNAHFRAGKMLNADMCDGYRVYANITDGGSPATGVTSVTADLSSVTSGATAITLTAGTYTVGGVNYAYRSPSLRTGVAKGSYGYPLTWNDGGGSHTRNNLTAVVNDAIPITAQWATGFEHGVIISPEIFSSSSNGIGVVNGFYKTGAKALDVSKTGTNTAHAAKDGFTATTVLSFGFRLQTLPTADVSTLAVLNASSTPLNLGFQASSGKLTLRWGANAASVAVSSIAASTWYTVDLSVDVSANPNTAVWRIDEVDQPAVSLAAAAQTVTDFRFGSTVTTDVFRAQFDDIVHSRSLGDYPIGPTRVQPSRPNGVGTHDRPENFSHEDGTAITSTSWDRLDDLMMGSGNTDGVRQETAGGHLRIAMQDTTEVCIRGVHAVVTQHKTASQTNNAKASVWYGPYEFVVWSGDSTYLSANPKTTMVTLTTTTGLWSPELFNGLDVRLGYASDINPLPYWDAVLLEYVTSG